MSDTPGIASVAASAELTVVTRSNFIESRHAGSAVVLSPEGETLVSVGVPETRFFTRSALKPLLLLGMYANGLELGSDEQRAMGLASHNGAPEHVAIVRSMLADHGLDEGALQCPADLPMGSHERLTHVAQGGKIASILHCCSGKHAAMLATCVANGWNTDDYLSPTHPLQMALIETVQRFSGEAPDPVGVDGCGSPTLALSLTGLARGVRRMAAAEATSPFPLHRNAHTLLQAARAHGWVVCGRGSGDTTLIDGLGVFSKFGAEGSVVVATTDGHVVVAKNLDGSSRGLHLLAAELLARVGAVAREQVDAVRPKLGTVITGGGKPVGEVRVTC